VRPDYRAVDHLQAGIATAAIVERFEQQFPQPGQRPTPELPVNRRPFTEMLVQIAPRDTRPRDPENPIQNKPMVPRAAPAPRSALDHKGLKALPLLVAHQTTNQESLPQSYLESEITRLENPLCQHILADRKNSLANLAAIMQRFDHFAPAPGFFGDCLGFSRA
jgi:hypothetical protein